MADEKTKGPTAAESLTAAFDRITHKKLAVILLTLKFLADAEAPPYYLLLAGIVGTAAIVMVDLYGPKKKTR